MANFNVFKDLHDFNRKLNEDDWNNGQHFVFKLKNSAKNSNGGFDLATTLKVAHSQPGENHTVKLEEKLKINNSDLGGQTVEVKATNDGKIAFQNEFTGLFKDVEGFENSAITNDGTLSAKGGLEWDAGFRHCGKDHHFHARTDIKADPKITTETVWRPCEWMVVGEKAEFNKELKDTKIEVKTTTGFPGAKGLHCGSWWKGTHVSGLNFNKMTSGGSLVHSSGSNTAGAQLDFDWSTHAIKTQIGFQNKQEDHTWKLMAHSSGMARALLQWQLHRCCKATINTSIDLGEVPSGKIAALPWGYGFEVKY